MALLPRAYGRRLAPLLAATGALGFSTVALAEPTAGPTVSTPRCSTANLRLDKVGEDDFTSHRGWIFAFRNVGSRTCQLKGYPTLRLLDANARAMPTRLTHIGGPPHAVVLAPWHRAFFATTFAVGGPCPQSVFAYGMAITPPRASAHLAWYAGRFDLCGPAPASLSVSPVAFPRQF